MIKSSLVLDFNYENVEMKTVKNLVNLTRKNTITVKFVNVPMGMYIVPIFLSTVISSIITALQFNNII